MLLVLSFLFSVFLIAIVTFGGGPVFIPMFEALIVGNFELMSQAEFDSLTAIVSSLPGPIGPKYAGYSAYLIGGIPAFIGSLFVFLAPGSILAVALFQYSQKLKNSPRFQKISIYIKPIVIGIFLTIIVKFMNTTINQINWISTIIVFLIAFYLIDRKKVTPALVIVLSLIYGYVYYLITS